MRHSKTTDYITCDRCGEETLLHGIDPKWVKVSEEFVADWRAPVTSHDLCPTCAKHLGSFLTGDFVPPIPDRIEQPYETLTSDDFFNPHGTGVAPWECDLMHEGHIWRWGQAEDNHFKRHCTRCSLLWTSSKQIEGTK